jgi:acyl dehydratase
MRAVQLGAPTQVEFQAGPPVTMEQLKTYAEVSGDFNPIHLSEEAARKVGLSGVIAHGMLLMAWIGERALRFAREEQGAAGARVSRIQARFRAMVFVGDRIEIGGVVKAVSADHWSLDLSIRNQKGETTTTAAVEITLT